MTKKKLNTPKHKRLNRENRLQVANHWLSKYNGQNKVRGYSKHFAVDLLFAANELRMLGIEIEVKYIKQLLNDKANRTKNNQLRKEKGILEMQFEQDEEHYYIEHYYIAGYTENGVPYGVPWGYFTNALASR